MKQYEKMISHRLRGFSEYELSYSALKKACKSKACYLEIDTRVSKDGRIFVHHDHKTNKDHTKKIIFSNTNSCDIKSVTLRNGENILTLEDALEFFHNNADEGNFLCIDIKDLYYEKQHLDLVRKFNLEEKVIFVSWIPQVLTQLKKSGCQSPLILSHWNLQKYGKIGTIITKLIRKIKLPFLHYVVIGKDNLDNPLENMSHGFQHTAILEKIPNSMLDMLVASSGGICIHKSMLSEKIEDYCKKNGLRLWVFSAVKKDEFMYLSKKDSVDVIFCDNIFDL